MSLESDLGSHISNFFSPGFADKVIKDILGSDKKTQIPSVLQMDKDQFMSWYFRPDPVMGYHELLVIYLTEELGGGLQLTNDSYGGSTTKTQVIEELESIGLQKQFELHANKL